MTDISQIQFDFLSILLVIVCKKDFVLRCGWCLLRDSMKIVSKLVKRKRISFQGVGGVCQEIVQKQFPNQQRQSIGEISQNIDQKQSSDQSIEIIYESPGIGQKRQNQSVDSSSSHSTKRQKTMLQFYKQK
eukprot:TRINITY_DN35077_c0_g1_i5.p2 TRINITY_DN35077_c0_g1~~TRINITY_DN35077_c0_g1_i5.p2  ORF type:complete len:131 (-),score=8.24 TRINITY_DN35077_c0_g1_i5:127-519(-)